MAGFLVSMMHGGCDDSAFSILPSEKTPAIGFCADSHCLNACDDEIPSLSQGNQDSHSCDSFATCFCSCHIPLLPLDITSLKLEASNTIVLRFTLENDRIPDGPVLIKDKPPIV